MTIFQQAMAMGRIRDGIADLLDTYHQLEDHGNDEYCEICDTLSDAFYRALLGEPQ